jgi:cyclopropane-fatty-acyl-phospholipid synthase
MQEILTVTPQTRAAALAGMPATVRTAFKLAEQIRCGTLEVSLPDGRRLAFKGAADGPTAHLVINDYRFA